MTSSNSEPPRLGEFALIAELFAPLAAKNEGAFGLKDDAATLFLPPGEELVVTVDALVEGVHFLRDDPAGLIAKKALRVNLSDLAAKGAQARNYLLALSLPDWIDDDWLRCFAAGLEQDQAHYGVTLLGGDTTSTPGPLTLSITALGSVPAGRMLRRAGAKPGDLVFVSGTIGDAGAGLEILRGEASELVTDARENLIRRYRLPEPRLALGRGLIGIASAALDVSDGLVADLGHIAEVSGVHIVIDAPLVPLSADLVSLWGRGTQALLRAMTAGDDYEIAFTAAPATRLAVADAARAAGVPVKEIGRVEAGAGVELVDEGGRPLGVDRPGFTHF
ncbi:MAG TPA: thiamine-phosphate kinase [Micropepsaceae bacterium]|nr:thiamine-phosphate kinase [Micropepsaceae bacterium]